MCEIPYYREFLLKCIGIIHRRCKIWKWLCTTENSISKEQFTKKAEQCKTPDSKISELDDDIHKDCMRTFIDGEDDAENKRKDLSIILKIYGRAHPEIGYTQGI